MGVYIYLYIYLPLTEESQSLWDSAISPTAATVEPSNNQFARRNAAKPHKFTADQLSFTVADDADIGRTVTSCQPDTTGFAEYTDSTPCQLIPR